MMRVLRLPRWGSTQLASPHSGMHPLVFPLNLARTEVTEHGG